MTRIIRLGMSTAIVGLATAAIMAQTPASSQTSPGADQKITVTGCLKEAPATPAAPAPTGTAGTTGTTGTAGTAGTATDSSAAQPRFLLTNASASPDAAAADSSAAAGTTTPPATGAPATSAAQTYRLIANPTALSPHVGKKLELTGTLESPASAAQTADTSPGPDANAPILKVQSGKIVAATCSQ